MTLLQGNSLDIIMPRSLWFSLTAISWPLILYPYITCGHPEENLRRARNMTIYTENMKCHTTWMAIYTSKCLHHVHMKGESNIVGFENTCVRSTSWIVIGSMLMCCQSMTMLVRGMLINPSKLQKHILTSAVLWASWEICWSASQEHLQK